MTDLQRLRSCLRETALPCVMAIAVACGADACAVLTPKHIAVHASSEKLI